MQVHDVHFAQTTEVLEAICAPSNIDWVCPTFSSSIISTTLSRSTSLAARRTSWKPATHTSAAISLAMPVTQRTYRTTAARTARQGSRLCLASYCRSLSPPSPKPGSPATSDFIAGARLASRRR